MWNNRLHMQAAKLNMVFALADRPSLAAFWSAFCAIDPRVPYAACLSWRAASFSSTPLCGVALKNLF